MTVRPIVFFPDQRLRQVAVPVRAFDNALHTLCTDLLDTLRAVAGLGITAPHIGIGLRVTVLDLPQSSAPRIYINPEIIWHSQTCTQNDEGSISMPGISAPVLRPTAIKIQYTDLHGNMHIEEASGLHAICLQHEIDQLNGIFWLQKLSSLKRTRLIARYEKRRG
ncbi:peptide deformylase [Acetobacter okinawensis]|uniref:peptide deformylase n=1 Tax=Acetobacter okinawensis TaxID=1076594 RepID=UPI0020A0CEB0|nr:peptide deformylase [Acetobacter okinawensis]MCP1211674.1 peptide deformylase [Acetobacter okinawensis]